MPDHGTRNAIFVLRRLVERSIQKQKDVFTCFIDYSKAFDTVKYASLFDLLSSLDIESHDIKSLANLYWNHQAAVRQSIMVVSPHCICLHCTLKDHEEH